MSNLQDPIGCLEGVGDLNVFGSQYAMRIWLGSGQARQRAADAGGHHRGHRGAEHASGGGTGRARCRPPAVRCSTRRSPRVRACTTAEQFRHIIVKTQRDGSTVRLDDVARVELGAESYDDHAPQRPSGLGHRDSARAGCGCAAHVRAGEERGRPAIEKRSPAATSTRFPLDSTDFVKLSIEEVIWTLAEAIILVVIVMFVFLQTWRATLIPAIAVPVVLLGTFGVLAVFGFTINTLTLFAMVLAIGLLVDDAIVVVENVERVMQRKSPASTAREATIKSMDEIQTALIAIALVLSAVFLPMAFFGGSVGEIYRQFSVTMVAAMLLSVVVALVLSPALAATLLKPPSEHLHARRKRITQVMHSYGDRFQAWFDRMADRYRNGVQKVLDHARELDGRLRRAHRSACGGVPDSADQLPAQRRSGARAAAIHVAAGRHAAAHARGGSRDRALLPQR